MGLDALVVGYEYGHEYLKWRKSGYGRKRRVLAGAGRRWKGAAARAVTHDLAKTTLQKFNGYKMNCAFIHVLDPRMSSTSMQRCAAVVTRVYSGYAGGNCGHYGPRIVSLLKWHSPCREDDVRLQWEVLEPRPGTAGWALSAVFYGATALAPDQPDCVPPETLLEKVEYPFTVVRSVVIAWIATVVGAIPLATLPPGLTAFIV
ncbi:hypothetical protein AK812_SmicGene23921 [Symbiodinium microadriaticum]|uniref:Uncharacterized protein n=1 Tax=Symbiodinium microadriaticum TaxID=2951 RepID=A0A1Q9DFZ0_SYMMI|nr:hypothetical protein AK812_SmicGene23921 [Symbiodinium microadriaticum]